jgi:hypothetical protein
MTEETSIEMGADGFFVKSGFTTIYPYSETTKESFGPYRAWVSEGGGLPAHSTLIKPPEKVLNKAYIFNGKGWDTVPDFRGVVVYNIQTKKRTVISDFGDLPANTTTAAPATEFDVWDGEKWIKDEQAELESKISVVRQEKIRLLRMTDKYIERVQDMLDFDMSDDESADKKLIKDWKRYRIQLGKIDVTILPVVWPDQPFYPYNGPI